MASSLISMEALGSPWPTIATTRAATPSWGPTSRQWILHKAALPWSLAGACTFDGETVVQASAIEVRCGHAVEIVNGPAPCEIMMLQARPIMEPVAQAGPFVMNSP